MLPQTVWITGGGSGIGRALARSFAGDGHVVAISGRRGEALAETAAATPGAIHCHPLDVTDGGAAAQVVAAIESSLGPIHIAVLNAGTYTPIWVEGFDARAFRDMIETNLIGVGNTIAPLLESMRARGSGTIVIVASVAGFVGLPGAAAYGASKAALINMAEALYPDARRYGIRIAVVCPGFVETPLTAQNDFAMPFLISAEEACRRIRRGLESGRFEIAFPRRFALLLKLARLLPYRLYFRLTARIRS
ncbi:SDR family NAD(P)-dependent oxidoreductase [Dongia sp.]|uniref:SDR family NAD(P)-dependent oxidoreductase n=1 Tax=Dongia sp. TaxID=1977262 RepID=UPI0037539D2F